MTLSVFGSFTRICTTLFNSLIGGMHEGKKVEVKEQVWTVMSVVTSIALGGSRTDNRSTSSESFV